MLLLLLDVWTHMRGVRLRGGLPGAVMRADVRQQRTVPGAKERGGERESVGTEKEVNNMSDRKE